ncbi:hypothetical protein [Nostoc sp.]
MDLRKLKNPDRRKPCDPPRLLFVHRLTICGDRLRHSDRGWLS